MNLRILKQICTKWRRKHLASIFSQLRGFAHLTADFGRAGRANEPIGTTGAALLPGEPASATIQKTAIRPRHCVEVGNI